MRAALRILGLLLALHAPGAAACGYCVEDKIASTYDHAVVTQALGQKHHVAFFHIDGPILPGDSAKQLLLRLAESIPGVDKGSVRVAVETFTISFAFDPKRAPLLTVQAAMDRKLRTHRLELMPLRTIESTGELKTVKR